VCGMRRRPVLAWIITVAVVIVLCGVASAGLEAPPLENPAPGVRQFIFAIAGDNRGGVPVVQPRVFWRILSELRALGPAFVLGPGDLIAGYESDETVIRQEWAEFKRAVDTLDMPYYPIVGNHDVWDEQSQRIWDELFGPTDRSFDYGNCHFVWIDSNRGEYDKPVPPDQLAWLEQDLAAHQDAEHRIVLMHVPWWSYAEDRAAWLRDVHPVLLKHRVDMVVAGHTHGYEKDVIDGIAYYVSGGAGAPKDMDEATGGIYHYLIVRVDGPALRVAVVQPGAVESDDYVRPEDYPVVGLIEANMLPSPVLHVGPQGLEEREIVLRLTNPFGEPRRGRIRWESPGANWAVWPQVSHYSLEAGESAELRFGVALANPAEANPPPRYAMEVAIRPDKVFEFRQGLTLVRRVVCPTLTSAPLIDGSSGEDEWRGAAAIEGFATTKGERAETQPRLALAHDGEHLYIAARAEATSLGRGRLTVEIDPGEGHAAVVVTLAAKGEVRVASVGAGAPQPEPWVVEGAGRLAPDGREFVWEVALPLERLGVSPPVTGKPIRLNVRGRCTVGAEREDIVWSWTPWMGVALERYGVAELQ